jgi:hypothetical protein
MRPAEHRGEGQPRPFGLLEYAGAKHVADVTREELLAQPDHPKIHGRRAISCACGHGTIGEHNRAVWERGR